MFYRLIAQISSIWARHP